MASIHVSGDTLEDISKLASIKSDTIRAQLGIENYKGITGENVINFCIETTMKYYKIDSLVE